MLSKPRVRLFATPWTVAYQAPPSMGFSRQEYWSGLPFPSPGNLPDSGIEPWSPTLQADGLTSEPPGKPTLYIELLKMSFFPFAMALVDHCSMSAPSSYFTQNHGIYSSIHPCIYLITYLHLYLLCTF